MTTGKNRPITDSPEQAKVIQSPVDADALVVAGAGSGKTYTMTRRIITLIEQGVAPERILGLTFTRKAAAELMSRVSSAVLNHEAATASATADGAAAAVANRMFLKPEVLTYDAFFQTIVRQYGLLVGFDQNTQPLSEAGARQLAADVIEDHMDLLAGRDFGAFSTVVGQVLTLSNAIGGSVVGPQCSTIAAAIARVREWDAAMLRCVERDIGDEAVPESAVSIKTGPIKRRATENDAKYARRVASARQDLRQYWHVNSVFNAARLRDTIEQREILLTLVEAYAERKQSVGMAEFSDFTLAAYRLVTRFEAIGERYRARYGHVLLDEYQDTSTTQSMVIATIFHPQTVRSRSSVTAVGDPFQSIYAWRGASPGAFRIFQQDFDMDTAVRPYSLSVTRRNARVILDAANNLTAPLRRGNTPRIASSSPMHEVEAEPLTAMDSAPVGTLGVLGYDTLGQEIDGVARFAKAAIGRHRQSDNKNGDEGSERDRTPHVAVLFRSKANMPYFVEGLERAGLSAVTVGYSALLERPEIKDVLALLHVVADHSDTASLMRLLATPRYAISVKSLNALASIAGEENTEFQFRALVQAGLADRQTPRPERAAAVAAHRDDVSNGVFLADILTRPDLGALLAHATAIDPEERRVLTRAAHAIRQVHEVMHRALDEVVRTAIQALGIDIDTVVAQAVDQVPISASLAHASTDALLGLIDTYANEIAPGQRPSLRGFVSWVDSLTTLDDAAAPVSDTDADVVLMTIHQSKGLEWDAVAVVGMQERSFPSSVGDSLSIACDEDHPGGLHEGRWIAPEYRERAKTWLEYPDAVPVPVRADAGILPRFPHDASDIARLDSVERLNAEINGDDMRVFDRNNGVGVDGVDGEGVDDAPPFLSQHEEYGRRLHADERRLAYVALTRAREDAMLSYHCSSSLLRDATNEQVGKVKDRPSNFWQEVHDSLAQRGDRADVSPLDGAVRQEPGCLATLESPLPRGFFVGERADAYMSAVVHEAWTQPVDEQSDADPLAWPITTTPRIRAMLKASARTVREAMRREARHAGETQSCERHGQRPSRLPVSGRRSLLLSAGMLIDDEYLMPWSLDSDDTTAHGLDAVVRERGARILARQRHNVTALQARSGLMDARQEHAYWMGLVRPIPQVASPSAQAGTRFHAWAERFISAFGDDVEAVSGDGFADASDEAVAGSGRLETRPSMLSELGELEHALNRVDDTEEGSGDGDGDGDGDTRNADIGDDDDKFESGGRERKAAQLADERKLALWERRLAQSRWASRRPVDAERQIVVAMPQLGNQIVVGKLDAIFYGGLDDDAAADEKRFTIVDWKTGVKPHDSRDVAVKLQQLDMYRLLLAAMEHVPLASIDATLYYLSESDEDDRELRARGKTEEEIVAELSSGIPQSSDND